ncbi:MAG: bacterio-opsin activator domain-containing protein [Halobacteriales archaeon]
MTAGDRLQRAPIGVIRTTKDGQVTAINETAATTIDADAGTLRGADLTDRFPRSAAGTLREAFAGGPPASRSFEEYYPELERWLAVDIDVAEDVVVYVRDRTERRETERTVERLEQRLDRIQGIDRLIVAVLQRLLGASDRTEVGETVCEYLGGSDPYTFAWVGDRDFPADRLRVVATGGTAPDLREEIDATLEEAGALPEQEAVATGETQLVETIATDESLPRGVRQAAFGNGLQSCLAVPLSYQGTVYGVVSVYSGQENGFSEQEQVGLETLGSVAGFAIKAIRQEDLLVADTVTEVTVRVRDETVPFVRAARETEQSLSLEGAVPRGDGSVVCYLGTDEAGEGLEEVLAESDDVTDIQWVRSEQDPLVQATVEEGAPVAVLGRWGATVRSAEYTAESAQIVAETPPDGDVRRMIEAVDATVAKTALVSKEETTRNPDPVEAFRDSLDERLTDRQKTVLRTAYLADYFESPRGSTSKEVAETLDITGPTVLYHLRRAQQKLIEAFLADDPETPSTVDR